MCKDDAETVTQKSLNKALKNSFSRCEVVTHYLEEIFASQLPLFHLHGGFASFKAYQFQVFNTYSTFSSVLGRKKFQKL